MPIDHPDHEEDAEDIVAPSNKGLLVIHASKWQPIHEELDKQQKELDKEEKDWVYQELKNALKTSRNAEIFFPVVGGQEFYPVNEEIFERLKEHQFSGDVEGFARLAIEALQEALERGEYDLSGNFTLDKATRNWIDVQLPHPISLEDLTSPMVEVDGIPVASLPDESNETPAAVRMNSILRRFGTIDVPSEAGKSRIKLRVNDPNPPRDKKIQDAAEPEFPIGYGKRNSGKVEESTFDRFMSRLAGVFYKPS